MLPTHDECCTTLRTYLAALSTAGLSTEEQAKHALRFAEQLYTDRVVMPSQAMFEAAVLVASVVQDRHEVLQLQEQASVSSGVV